MPTIVGVKFKSTGKTYYFDPCGIQFKVGDGAIVETARGTEFAWVAIANKDVPDSQIVGELKPVKNKARQADIDRYEKNIQRKAEIMRVVREKIAEHGLDMHLKDMDFSYDNSKMTFYYSADDRVDFRELVKDLGSTLRTRVELRQIGIRDETKMLGGLGSCGRPCCCSSFLNGFERVSIKMAKVQGLSLNPVNISGLCGRLMCCLKYENDHYVETAKIMPKVNDIVKTPDGEGKVEYVDLLRREVRVQYTDDNGMIALKAFKVKELDVLSTTAVEDDLNADEDTFDDFVLEEISDQPAKAQQPSKPKILQDLKQLNEMDGKEIDKKEKTQFVKKKNSKQKILNTKKPLASDDVLQEQSAEIDTAEEYDVDQNVQPKFQKIKKRKNNYKHKRREWNKKPD